MFLASKYLALLKVVKKYEQRKIRPKKAKYNFSKKIKINFLWTIILNYTIMKL